MQIKDSETHEHCFQLLDDKRGSSGHDLSLQTLPPAIGDLAIKIDLLDASSHFPEWWIKSTKLVTGPSSFLTSKEVHVLLSHDHGGEQSTNKFLLPFAQTISDKTAWDALASNFSETCYIACYWEWVEEVLSRHNKVLLDAKIYDAVHASLFTYDYCDNVLNAFLKLWYHMTNTLHSSTSKLAISLWDLRKLGGLPIHGTFYDKVAPSADELCGTSTDEKPWFRQVAFIYSLPFINSQKEQKMFGLLTGFNFDYKAKVDINHPHLESIGEEFHQSRGQHTIQVESLTMTVRSRLMIKPSSS
ncbi:hypothetical protein ACH5RR_029772 [Cinchona calisaya]|uniref:Aminotransferase-like plant mobile domain-containing protein n=1 Tax=Cinchona calisaya TaxID=153742 RepID=A0ABD2YUY0_9GENT